MSISVDQMETSNNKKSIHYLERQKSDMIEHINKYLERSWAPREHTRRIDFLQNWYEIEPIVSKVIWEYRFAGWHALDYFEGDERYFLFFNPAERRFNDGHEDK